MQDGAMDPSPAAALDAFLDTVDPAHHAVLRPGTSHLKTLDIPTLVAFEADAVTGFARQAGGLLEYVRDHGDDLPKG